MSKINEKDSFELYIVLTCNTTVLYNNNLDVSKYLCTIVYIRKFKIVNILHIFSKIEGFERNLITSVIDCYFIDILLFVACYPKLLPSTYSERINVHDGWVNNEWIIMLKYLSFYKRWTIERLVHLDL